MTEPAPGVPEGEPTPGAPAPGPGPAGLGVWSLAWPTMVSFGLQSLVGVVDFAIVAGLGAETVAAVGIAHQVYFAQFAVLAGVTTGTVALVARAIGAGDPALADRTLRVSVLLGVAIGLLTMGLIPVAAAVVGVFGVEAAVVDIGASYLRILLAFNVPLAIGVVLSSGVRGAGDVRTPLVLGAIVNVLNVFLNYGLVYGRFGLPELGADGSALGTGMAIAVGTAAWIALWWGNRLVVERGPWLEGLTAGLARRVLAIGIPTFLEQAAFQVGIVLFLRIVAGFGTTAVSAYLIGVRILSLSFVPGLGYATAASTLVGQHLGAGHPGEAMRAGWRATQGAVVVMGSVGLSIILLARPVASIFGAAGEETVGLTVTFIYILGAAQPLMALEFALGGGLRGAGDTRYPLLVILAGLFGMRLPGALVLWQVVGASVTAVWSCLLADYALKATLLAWRFRSGRWQQVRV